jgi:glucose/arabinose dehydrogenase
MYKEIISSVFLAVLTTDCNQTKKESQPITRTPVEARSVETENPNASYQPAFAGQTRIAAVKTKANIESKILTDKLEKPWGIATLPDGRFLITQKGGTMRIVTPSGTVSEPITGLPPVDDNGQGGLLGLALDPSFETNRIVYFSFSLKSKAGNQTAVGKGRLSDDEKKIEGPTIIYSAMPVYDGDKHFGSRLVFDRDGNLFVSTGERSDLETRPQAQKLNSALGKIVRITKDGRPAPDNPTFNDSKALPEIFSYGHRNTQGLAIHPQTGDLWNSEMGPKGGDEINIIRAGKNYGWPIIGYGLEYSGEKVGKGITQKSGLEQPIYYWDPVLSPSGMTFYSGNAIPEWENNLFICGLSSRHIARIVIKDNKVTGEERLLAKEGERFRDVTQGKDGALYAVTDSGRLYWIGVKK